jgi:hypothetical protein
MERESLRDTGLVRALTDLMADVKVLLQNEMRLAGAELKTKLAARLQASVWMAIAGLLGFIAILLLVEGAVLVLATLGLSLYGSCFLVAIAIGALAAILFFYGRSLAEEDMLPTRTLKQMNQDINTAKEQLT